jgi:hypothetical protein
MYSRDAYIHCARAGELAHLAPSMYLWHMNEIKRAGAEPARRTGVTAMSSVAIALLQK